MKKISYSEIPFEQLKKVGFEEKKFMGLGKSELERLLAGFLSQKLYELKVDDKSYQAKLSFERTATGVNLKLHPIRREIQNDFDLKISDIEKLKKFGYLSKYNQIYQLDRKTNEVLRVNLKDITIPKNINGIALSGKEIAQLKKGNVVKLKDSNVEIKLDLDNPKGFSSKAEWEKKQEMEYDRFAHDYVGGLKTDKNRAEFQNVVKRQSNTFKR